jgi:hypothetical protein
MTMRLRPAALALVSVGAMGHPLVAQDLPVLDARATRFILQEISGDAAYEHIRYMTQFHRPRGGADGLWEVARYYEAKAREVGLQNVRLIRQTATARPWNARFADLWIVEPDPERLASTLQSALHLADYSRSADVTAPLVDLGAADSAAYARVDVRGKIVLAYGPVNQVMGQAVGQRGALGVVWYPNPRGGESVSVPAPVSEPDQLRWTSLQASGTDGREPTFAFVLSARQGIELSARLSASAEPVTVRAVVDAQMSSAQGSEPWQVMVEATLPGSEPGLRQDIVLTGHLQEEGFSANDDASGTASVLEIGRALAKLIREGRIPAPRRTIRFWWVTEISSQRQYFADHPDEVASLWVNVNQDMVGANQAQGVMRKQNVTRVPATRFHFLNDVVEAVVEYLVKGNTSELAVAQNGIPFYPIPHLAHLGTRHRYNAEMIWFHNNTDHMPFNEAPIGVPAVTFTNMPDHYIHSSADDLWNVDRTQLGRNAAGVALIAYAMATADSAGAPVFAANTAGRGLERLARNLRLGLTWIAERDDPAAAYTDALDQTWYAAERERLALRSLGQIAPAAAAAVPASLQELARWEAEALRRLGAAYRRRTGRDAPRSVARSAAERELAALRPTLTAGPADFLTGRGRIGGVAGLHGLMAFEILSAVNGERSGLDIYRYVAAEAREAGRYYFGTVSPEAVLEYLGKIEAAGLGRR